MAVLVIFVFMRDWRSTLISALALPTSVIATFFFMYIAGLHHQHDDADGAVARHRHPDRRCRGGAREHLPAHGAGRGPGDRRAQRHRADRARRDGDDLHDPGRVPARRVHDGHRRAVLQVVRADHRVRRVDVAARRVHARPDAVVALRPLHPARGAHADAHRPLLERWGRYYDQLDAAITGVLEWSLDRPWTRARHGRGRFSSPACACSA